MSCRVVEPRAMSLSGPLDWLYLKRIVGAAYISGQEKKR
jgi:hypothetical protein